jgi:hypothetical protein
MIYSREFGVSHLFVVSYNNREGKLLHKRKRCSLVFGRKLQFLVHGNQQSYALSTARCVHFLYDFVTQSTPWSLFINVLNENRNQ